VVELRSRTTAVLAWALWLVTFGCCAAGLLVTLAIIRPLTVGVLGEGALYAFFFVLGSATVGLVLALGVAGLGGRGPAWMTQVRAGAILVVGVALQATAGGAGGWFAAWPFVLVAVYPLALPGPGGLVVAGLTILTLLFLTGLFESLAGVRATVEDMLVRSGLADAIGRDHLYREVEDAAGDASA
jgi:hypothetical protein